MINILKARENNLQSINVNLPHNQLIVVTGVSGSGKSTLVYDIIYQEARRRYIESFSSNARQFLGKLNRPDVEFLAGLSPAIMLEQRQVVQSPRSTVGTLTEIYDLLRLLFARIGESPNLEKEDINRTLFSFNTTKGACPHCKGLGVQDEIDPELLIADRTKTIREGAFTMTTPSGYIVYSQVTMDVLNQVCNAEGFTVDIPWKDLSPGQKKVILYGSDKIKVPFGKHTLESRMKWSGITAKPREEGYYKGIVPVMEEILVRDRNPNVLRFARTVECPKCGGSRLNASAQSVKVKNRSITHFIRLSISQLIEFFNSVTWDAHEEPLTMPIVEEILKTARTIDQLGLGFLSLNRPSGTLSGGETQRLRLSKMVTSKLRGVMYIFDEPSVGLHPKDTAQLIKILMELRDNGNTVVVVEHNEIIMRNADWIVDLGPGAGKDGGLVLFNGKAKDFFNQENAGNSCTLNYLNQSVEYAKIPDNPTYFHIEGASIHNLKNINVSFRLKALNVITGVSGAGKTSLIDYTLARFFNGLFNNSNEIPGAFDKITNHEGIKKITIIDQSAIGKTPRSNPATYTGLSDALRNLFASLESAKKAGLKKSHFSFNTKGGRCERCQGAGYEQVGLHLLGTVEVLCPECLGKQYKPEVLKINYNQKSIADIYSMTISEACEFFKGEKTVFPYLKALQNIGLGYLTLKQRSSTLSGGEARRVKLAKGLAKPSKQHTLYIIDEPASGLHPYDVEVLLNNLYGLINEGHTVVLVEHHPTFIKKAHHLVELGPDSGEDGGEVVFQGIPKNIEKVTASYTAKTLKGEYNRPVKQSVVNNQFFSPIQLKGITTNNLKNIDVEIPIKKLTMITGVSGSGKSSLAFDTLFTEGRQRYAESFSAYVRNRLNINSNAKFESIRGIIPTIAVSQKSVSYNERSTVGTLTDIYDSLRLLFARVAKNGAQEKPMASLFSFNHEQGACKTCSGLGYNWVCDAHKLITHPDKPLVNGALNGSKPGRFFGEPYGQYVAALLAVGEKHGIDYYQPFNQLSKKAQNLALKGTGEELYEIVWKYKRKNRQGEHRFTGPWPGFLELVNQDYLKKAQDKRREAFESVLSKATCLACKGKRLNHEALSYTINNKTIADYAEMPASGSLTLFRKMVIQPGIFSQDAAEERSAQIIAGGVINGLDILERLGLGYLSLARDAATLSGGEAQRVRLAGTIHQDMSGVCLILDEPTTGLHETDMLNLHSMLRELIRQGNTVVVCEHDPDFIKEADYIIDMGPHGGEHGGKVLASGSVQEVMQNKASVTGNYLATGFQPTRKINPEASSKKLMIKEASANNLKNIDVTIPLNRLVVLTGISGSGKSSLMDQVIYASAQAQRAINCAQINGLERFEKIIYASQKLPGAHALSSVSSYLDIYPLLKKKLASVPEAKEKGLKEAHFSLNGKQGTCPKCKGKGQLKTAMDFLSDVYETCDECSGQRFISDVLQIRWQGRNIYEWLNQPFDKLVELGADKKLPEWVNLGKKLGLGYLKLGQNLNSLSGGELQRLKLLNHLMGTTQKPSLFLMDEPTTGLHMQDVEMLLAAFDELLEKGHSLLVIGHHKSLINNADVEIKLGPGAGEDGGQII